MIKKTKIDKEFQVVVFKLSGVSYAIGIKSIRDVIKMVDFVPLPNAPDYIAGVINLRGHIICVMDLRKKFGLKSENTNKTRIMIIMIQGNPVGIIVDEVEEVITLKKSDIDLAPSIIDQHLPGHCIIGIANYNEKLIILINVNNLLSPDDLQRLNLSGS